MGEKEKAKNAEGTLNDGVTTSTLKSKIWTKLEKLKHNQGIKYYNNNNDNNGIFYVQ